MQQVQKVHAERIEYRTVNLVYWNFEEAANVLDLFNLNKRYAGETTFNTNGTPLTFVTRSFDLNLGDKAQVKKIEIYNFSIENPDAATSPDFNQVVLLNSSLFDYGPIPIALNDADGNYSLNALKIQWTPTKQVVSSNTVSFSPVKPYSVINTAGPDITTNSTLLLNQQADAASAGFFTLSFVVKLYYDNY